MNRPGLLVLLLAAPPLAAQSAPAAATNWTAEQQITAALLPLPEPLRADAAVYRWEGKSLVQIRPGSNGMICFTDDPARKNFHVACYHRDLEPFMAAGRQASADGLSPTAVDSVRKADIAAKRWAMPAQPTMLYELFAADGAFDPATGTLTGGQAVYVLYTPYATEAGLGLTRAGQKGAMPWMMDAGEPWAHIMITP